MTNKRTFTKQTRCKAASLPIWAVAELNTAQNNLRITCIFFNSILAGSMPKATGTKPSQNQKRCFAYALADTKTPHLILPNRTQSPPITRPVDG